MTSSTVFPLLNLCESVTSTVDGEKVHVLQGYLYQGLAIILSLHFTVKYVY